MSWRIAPLKRLVDPERPITYGIVQAGEDVQGGVPYVRPVDMQPWARDLDPASLRTTDPRIAARYRRSEVAPGDVIVSIGPSYGKLLLAPPYLAGANLTQGTARVAPANDVDGRYLQYALSSRLARDWWAASVGGATFGGLNLGPLANTPVPRPPVSAQHEVADFLDRECERIADLESVAATLAARLLEPALGTFLRLTEDLPLTQVGHHYEVQLGKMLDQNAVIDGELVPYLRNQNVAWDSFDLADVKNMRLTYADRRRYEVRQGDLLACEGRHVGKSAVWEGQIAPVYYQKALHRIRPLREASNRFLMWCLWLGNARGDYYADGTGSTIPHLPAEKLRRVRIPSATRDQQDAVTGETDDVSCGAARALDVVSGLRSRLAEYRDALVTEAVTGQLDVTAVSNAQMAERAHAAAEGAIACDRPPARVG